MQLLNMPGPDFLALYLALAVVVYVLTRLRINRIELDSAPATQPLRDPYRIAFLRAGPAALLRTVCLALIVRKLLQPERMRLLTIAAPDKTAAGTAIETAVLTACVQPITVEQLIHSPSVWQCVLAYEHDLVAQGLLAGRETKQARTGPVLLAMGVLVALAALKINIALNTGHHNIGYLVVLAALSVPVLLGLRARRLTARGRQMLTQIRGLFGGLQRQSLRDGQVSATNAALLGAIFGVYGAAAGRSNAWALTAGSGGSGPCGSAGGGSSCGSGGGGGSCGGGGGCGGCGGGG